MSRPRALADAPVQASFWERLKAAGGAVKRGLGTAASYVNPVAWYRWFRGQNQNQGPAYQQLQEAGDDAEPEEQPVHGMPAHPQNQPGADDGAGLGLALQDDSDNDDSDDDHKQPMPVASTSSRPSSSSTSHPGFLPSSSASHSARPGTYDLSSITPPSWQELQEMRARSDREFRKRHSTRGSSASSSASPDVDLTRAEQQQARQRAEQMFRRNTHWRQQPNGKWTSHKAGKAKEISEAAVEASIRSYQDRIEAGMRRDKARGGSDKDEDGKKRR